MLATLALLACALAAAPAGDEPWPALVGSGLLTLPDAATLPPGRFRLGLALDNRDRDPLGLDVFDYALAWNVGVTRRIELSGRHVFSRVVALPEVPALPPPPLDLVAPRGATLPARPWYPLYSPTPYVNHRGDVRFESLTPGDARLALKLRLLEPRGARPALALRLEATLPLTTEARALASGSGTGSVDVGARGIAEWRVGRQALVANVAFTRVGTPAVGDRVIRADAGSASVEDQPLRLRNRLELGVGVRRPLSSKVALALESVAFLEVGRSTKVLDRAPPLDALAGAQFRLGRLRGVAGLLYHGHSLESGAIESAPLAGIVDLTGVAPQDAARWLEAIGLGAAAPLLRSGVQRAVAAPAGSPPPPAGARVIPATYHIRSEHQMGLVFTLGVGF